MSKTYLRFSPRPNGVIGVITSSGNTIYDASGKFAVCPSLERINRWNLRTGELESVITTNQDPSLPNFNVYEVTKLTKSPDKQHIAAGCVIYIFLKKWKYFCVFGFLI